MFVLGHDDVFVIRFVYQSHRIVASDAVIFQSIVQLIVVNPKTMKVNNKENNKNKTNKKKNLKKI